jgi:hypothetical protein
MPQLPINKWQLEVHGLRAKNANWKMDFVQETRNFPIRNCENGLRSKNYFPFFHERSLFSP